MSELPEGPSVGRYLPEPNNKLRRDTLLEARIEARFFALVRRHLDGIVTKLAATTVGVPDRMVILPGGRIVLVELKTLTGRLSPKQVHWHAEAEKRGVTVVTLRGIVEVERWVSQQLRFAEEEL